MAVTHIVLFKFKSAVPSDVISDLCAQVILLKDNCLNPSTNKPYIKSFVGGQDHSPEGLQDGMTHGFVAVFETLQDRDYYVSTDPVHLALGKKLGEVLEKVQVIDFTSSD
ncbi:uncharacterized protein N7529_004016 [Penicillium soppii]|uniref:uncharacterized protein n=1 Tax=Penicillium soppii TaxID=69789 RepID=UPI002548AAA9|nr:uncharacterized protein N7529_004016 [Penicillium soppii]KAJ5871663.1 hypothetical protein N7529_004016 [Penicillium soppii]